MRRISTRTLMKVAAYGAVVVVGTGLYLQNSVKQNIRNTEFYKSALKTLRAHPGAIQFLGEPIKDNGFNYRDTQNNNFDDTKATFAVNVTGSKDKGVMYFWADKLENEWNVNRMELELKSRPNERLKIVGVSQTSQ